MADIKVILANYKPVVGDVSNGAKSVSITTPELIAKTSQPSIPTSFADTSLNVIVENAGETSIPEAGIGRFAGDNTSIADTYSKQIGKRLGEIKTISDVFSRTVLFQRVFAELKTTAEQLVFNSSKNIVETFARTEQVIINLQKIINESFTRVDVASFLFEGVYYDSTSSQDLVVFNPNKGLVEIQSTTDILTRVFTVSRSFTDIVDATDDVLGEANVDDDQVSLVNKAAIDWVAQVDSYVLSTFKVFNDLGALSDISYFDVVKAHNDIPLTVDLLYFEILTRLTDETDAADVAYYSFGKLQLDFSVATDVYSLSQIKIVYDNNVLTDTNSKILQNVYNDIANESDIVYQDFSKYLSHSFSNADVTYSLIDKGLVETQLTSEVLSFRLDYNLLDNISSPDILSAILSKPFSDTFNKQDLAYYLVGKRAFDSYNTSDLVYFDKTKSVEDLVDATDDVFGEANIDDDQIAAVAKTLADYATTVEDFSRVFTSYRDYADTVNESDIIYLKPGLSKLETTQTSDNQVYGIGTVYNEVESIIDVDNKEIYSVYADLPVTSETLQFVSTFLRSFAEVESISETLSKLYLKQLIESTVTSELFVKNINKGLTDIVTTAESITPINGRSFSEPQDISDSGTANNQNYFSSDYVEPGYVGTNTYF